MKQYPKVMRHYPDRRPALILPPEPVSLLFALLVLAMLAVSIGLFAWWVW